MRELPTKDNDFVVDIEMQSSVDARSKIHLYKSIIPEHYKISQ